MQELNWSSLKYVLAVARSKSLAEAARKLTVNETTVSRRIAQIEKQLNARVFERLRGVLVPTVTGEAVIQSAERIENETQHLLNTVSGADQLVAGKVRLTAVPIMLNHVLVPRLPMLVDHHPELQVEMVADSRDLSLINRQADIAVRLARPTKENRALARRVGQFDYAPYVRSDQLEHRSNWITFEDSMNYLPQSQWITNHTKRSDQNSALIRVNDGETILACVKAGLGKSLLPTVIGDADSELERLGVGIALSREVWLMSHPDLRQLARIKQVINWVETVINEM